MGRKGNLAVFESTNISETEEVMPTKIGVHVSYINTYLHEFFAIIVQCFSLISIVLKRRAF